MLAKEDGFFRMTSFHKVVRHRNKELEDVDPSQLATTFEALEKAGESGELTHLFQEGIASK